MTPPAKPSPPLVRPPHSEGASALIGSALHLSLRGRVRLLIWVLWGALTLLALGVFFLTIPARYSQLVIIGAENSIALQELGLPQTFFALHTGVLDAVLLLAYTAVGILIFARKAYVAFGSTPSPSAPGLGIQVVPPFPVDRTAMASPAANPFAEVRPAETFRIHCEETGVACQVAPPSLVQDTKPRLYAPSTYPPEM